MLLNKAQKLLDVGHDFGTFNISSFLGDGHGGNCGFEVTGGDIEPLINEGSLVEVGSVEFVFGGSKVPDDGVRGEEGALFGFEEGEGVEDGDVGEVRVGVVLNVGHVDFEGVDDRFYLSVPAVGDAVVAEVELHRIQLLKL